MAMEIMSPWILLVGAGICLIISTTVLRLSHILPYVALGSLIPVIGCLLLTRNIKLKPFNQKEFNQKRKSRYAFFRDGNWEMNAESLNQTEKLSTTNSDLYTDNFVINDTLNNIIILIINNFVLNWAKKISSSESFGLSLRNELNVIVKNLEIRLADINYSDLIVLKIIPILNEHIKTFLLAQEITKRKKIGNKSNKKITDLNDDLTLALNYNRGRLHPSLSLHSNVDDELKSYLSTKVTKILPFLMDQCELDSKLSQILVTQLVSSCVLKPVCDMLSDPNFFNQMIVDNLSKQMKDRNDVKRIRNILRYHSRNFSGLSPMSVDMLKYNITLQTTSKEFREILDLVEKSEDYENLRMFKYTILLQRQNLTNRRRVSSNDESKEIAKYRKRVSDLCYFIDDKVTGNIVKSSSIQTNDANQQERIYPDIKIQEPSFMETLFVPSKKRYFSYFMQQRGERQILLDFCLAVESLKNPLEFNLSHDNIGNVSFHEDEESSDEEDEIQPDKDMSQSREIKTIFHTYFNSSVMKIPPKIYYKVSEYVNCDVAAPVGYNRARKNLFKLQLYEYNRMAKSDFLAFKSSDLWMKLLVDDLISTSNPEELGQSNDQTNRRKESNIRTGVDSYGDPLAVYGEHENAGNYVDVNMSGKVSDKVVKAVEDALNEIVYDQGIPVSSKFIEDQEKRNSRLVSDDVVNDLFGEETEGMFSDADDSFEASTEQISDSTLLNNSSSENLHNNEPNEDFMSSVEQLQMDLSVIDLSKELIRLEDEIKRLNEQKMILNTLLNKAEVINNIPECRILGKSLLSLDKELKLKTMQKEQYLVQEGQNSLYQKCKIDINNYITVKDDNGKTFVMFAINVSRVSLTNPSHITASWIVTRRFSQFYELHQYLKNKYPQVSAIDFPKRNVMVKFVQSSLIEDRQKRLTKYLRELINIESVCSDRIFCDFVSSETFNIDEHNAIKGNFIKGNADQPHKSQIFGGIVSNQALHPLISLVNPKGISESSDDLKSITANPENEPQSSNEKKYSDSSLSKPICDLVIMVFQLSTSTNWLRGKGLILLFQQIFGSTIEKTVRSTIDGKIRNEEVISQLLTTFQSKLFPDGNFRQKTTPPTKYEKNATKQQAKLLLKLFLSDTSAKVFGKTAANEAANVLYNVLQNEMLNKHFVMTVLDEVLVALFPEMVQLEG